MTKTAFAAGQLRAFVERVERLTEEKKALQEDLKEVYSEAKGQGFCTKTLRKIIALRAMEESDRQEAEAMLDLYMDALGMRRTPLGDYADKIAAE
ncbi:MAG: DUF2312 domain-containing protein [Rhizomicrobium sp.]